ncbi:septum formation protein [Haloactinopolyspora alba]|uniref:Nucleoside triphosphate pyrophosphatase n=1 Tax=Haloactinopolyspora alba TaxID=648780 RepID=A0A2P8E189_9ACTN|nr:nucleoside triphosphate pyrophosphatase [Haloactinopolyspora alba]PSL03177.1 septum formation protein [Haloactinopolyspora alba]
MRLLLASQSPARLATLRAAGIEPVVQVSGVDEDAVLDEAVARRGPLRPGEIPLLLARAKAEQVADRTFTDMVVLGCDSLLELDGQVYGKPSGPDDAAARWRLMRGRSGVLHTGHWVIDLRESGDGGSGESFGATATTTVHFADITDAEIDTYVATGEPLRVAGAFTVDGLGGAFVTGIEGDHHAVVGLSLPLLRTLLADMGVSITDLWRADPDHEPLRRRARRAERGVDSGRCGA